MSALFHDAAAAVMVDGQLVAAAQEERFSRRKQDRSVPWRAVRSCLDEAGLAISELDCLAYYEDPALKADRQRVMLAGESRADVTSELLRRMDPEAALRSLREGLGFDGPIRLVPHHLSHAASAFYFSGFEESAVLVLDAVGEWATSSYGRASVRSGITLWEADRFPDSLGLFYSTVTAYLGFEVNEGEYKTMGLAPLGRPRFVEELRRLIDCDERGNVRLDLDYFDFLGLRRMWSERLVALLGRPPRGPGEELTDWHADLARSVQVILEEIVLRKARAVRELTGAQDVCMAGGVALNCVATAALRAAGVFRDIFVPPAAGDAGGAVGAAAQTSFDLGVPVRRERLAHSYLGPRFDTERDVLPVLRAAEIAGTDYRGRTDDLLDDVVRRLAGGQVIGWFQGRMEFGPRALGARSILADPRQDGMRDHINALVKLRESFRPFAPSVLREHTAEYFDTAVPQPFMLETVPVKVSSLPSVTHVDGTARLQTVDAAANPRYAALLERWRLATGCAVLLNTSFNQRGEPIVCTPVDALACFVRAGLDALVIEDVVVELADLPVAWLRTPDGGSPLPPPHDRSGAEPELAVYELV